MRPCLTQLALIATTAASMVLSAASPIGATESADVRLRFEGWKGRPFAPSGSLGDEVVIGEEFTFWYTVTNFGTVAVQVDLTLDASRTYPLKETDSLSPPVRGATMGWEGGPNDCEWGFPIASCTFPLAAGDSYWVFLEQSGGAPGTVGFDALATSSQVDPAPENNDWSVTVRSVCSISGTPGPDYLVGTPEIDSICGGEGDDHIVGVGGDTYNFRDRIFGEEGDDLLEKADAGPQHWEGGPGKDTLTYANAPVPVEIWLGADGEGETQSLYRWGSDSFRGIDAVVGSPYGDYLDGARGPQVLVGGPGNDRLVGGRGSDTLIGEQGRDRFRAEDSARDLVSGGRKRDRANVDSRDRVLSARRVDATLFELVKPR